MAVISESRNSFAIVYAECPRSNVRFGIAKFMDISVVRLRKLTILFRDGIGPCPQVKNEVNLLSWVQYVKLISTSGPGPIWATECSVLLSARNTLQKLKFPVASNRLQNFMHLKDLGLFI